MIRRHSFFAKWRDCDIDFLNSLNLNKTIRETFDGFWIEEGDTYNLIMEHYSKKDGLFKKTKPPKFSTSVTSVIFTKEEIMSSRHSVLTGNALTYNNNLLVDDGYRDLVYRSKDNDYMKSRIQIAPFRMKKPKWGKNQNHFMIEGEQDRLFLKKDVYQEAFEPLGLGYLKVLDYDTGEPLEDTVQLEIPIAESKLMIEGTLYDEQAYFFKDGTKQYSPQHLDFFPCFENDFDFHICYSQEVFSGGYKKMIISETVRNVLKQLGIIKYESPYLIPMK